MPTRSRAASSGSAASSGPARRATARPTASASVLVRPEDLQLGPRRPDWAAATVRHRTFLGERIHLRVEAAGQPPLLADVPRDSPFNVGDDVGLWIAPDRLMASMETAA